LGSWRPESTKPHIHKSKTCQPTLVAIKELENRTCGKERVDTAKPANVRSLSTWSLSRLLASLTCYQTPRGKITLKSDKYFTAIQTKLWTGANSYKVSRLISVCGRRVFLLLRLEALLMKHLDKFYNSKDIPWVKLIWATYYSNGEVPHATKEKGLFWWRDVIRLCDMFRGIASCNVGAALSCFG
jgi:hypothetical protein